MAALLAMLVLAVPARAANPVLPGDYPDPSVIRVGDEYWATATSSEWAPLFPLMRSRDLVTWEHAGNVFARRPDWAVGNFWAPEIAEHKGKFFIYYTARKRGGPLSVAVATADKPAGPWTDHGPMVSQDAGSIDAVPVTDTDGSRWLIWKEDGNSRRLPTPLWIQKLSEDGTKLTGTMKEVFRNDAPWEGQLVEGPFVQRHGDFFYMFYSGAGCCGPGCNYALGVARAKTLAGPWEKFSGNPILTGNAAWKCPGHGSIVTDKSGRDFLLYHAYDPNAFIYVGRQGLLDEIIWGANGWPLINAGRGPGANAGAPRAAHEFADDFTAPKLRPQWQWPVNNEPRIQTGGGKITIASRTESKDPFAAAVLALKTTTGDYTATAELAVRDLAAGRSVGLAAFGDGGNALGMSARDGRLIVWKRQRGKHENLGTNALPAGDTVFLRMTASAGHRFSFSASTDGKTWTATGGNIDLEGDYLPPWDRGIRVALLAGGEKTEATFRSARVAPLK
jgi:beta-xylosidase